MPRAYFSSGVGFVVSAFLVTLFSQNVWAQASSAPAPVKDAAAYNSPEYKDLVQRALQEYDLGHWSEARVFFARAHELAPNARTLRGLALVSYESRRYVDAIRFGELAVANTVQPLTATMRAQLQQFLDQARSFVGHARIVTKPSDAELRVDGMTVQRPSDGVLTLDAGTHELVVIAAGYETQSRTLNLEGGSEVRFDINLTQENTARAVETQPEPSNVAIASANERAETSSSDGSSGGSVAPWIVIGASAAVLAGGAVMLALGAADKSKVENVAAGTPYSEVKDAYERAPVLLNVGWVLAGVGLAGVAAGLTWKLWLEPDGRHEHARLQITPGGLKLSGSF